MKLPTSPLNNAQSKAAIFDKHPQIWRAREKPLSENKFSLGVSALDEALHGGIVTSGVVRVGSLTGIGEITLFKQVLAAPRTHKLRVFIKPPAQLQAPWLSALGLTLDQIIVVLPKTDKEALWAAEQCLKSTACHCVLLWNNTMDAKAARRLQVAASHNDSLCLLFTSPDQQAISFPISLDLNLQIRDSKLMVNIVKQRHGWPVSNIEISHSWTPSNHTIQWAMQNNKEATPSLHSVI
ncbi:translesion DNA synthesis-associated protein ImuA [Alteromonas sp. 1_MG-2023]|uniref:translesion DNA synthesis-associated protein ImuA n=1 Tax=Alteromonas sp. 1_MG-2023 TaxID=3062669 RepID=UPI0026E378B1|nr:translesion DNA synthesis-associated protein ImuA [Alteromonas sp. 1_MG-2023]MDO6566452.1 translesion DNA synthesis-associated protein ImuA [Alteromonas sp. 1_MG-2023]